MVENNKNKIEIPTLEDHHYLLFNKEFDTETTSVAIEFIIRRNLMEITPKQIKMIINSLGGSVTAAFALIDTMKGSNIPIHTFGLGQIASCGLLTFIAGEKGKRFITPNTTILSHQYFGVSVGKEHELMARVKDLNITSERILKHYNKCTGLSEKEIKKYLLPAEDVYLTAKEAVKLGIADKIVEFY